ncbi:MAG: type II toxin-antitoxin system Phd/YefM family antitoxin [Acidobacteriia bacterium]|nr:type II toxin-antitoxin system Phd/YefM family antitoxin [Terriglobia bacterium]
MNASILDLRYKTRDILKALENRERVLVTHRGKPKGTIVPLTLKKRIRVSQHEFFGMSRKETASMTSVMNKVRGGRHDF